MNLMELFVKIGVDKSGFEKGIGETEKETKSFASRIAGGMGKIASGIGKVAMTSIKVGGAAMGAAATGVAAITKAAVSGYGEMEQLRSGAEKIFDGIDFSTITRDANNAYKELGMSATEYYSAVNQAGATFAQTMGAEEGYNMARKGMIAISDYATGTGKSISELTTKFQMITRSTSSYQSIADQFSGILPQTSADFLEQAQAAGLLSKSYKKLTEVPVAEYQKAVTAMLERGVNALNLTGNTAMEAERTITGSIGMVKAAWRNFVTGLADPQADLDQLINNLVDSFTATTKNIVPTINKALKGIGRAVKKIVPIVTKELPGLVKSLLPDLLDAAGDLFDGLANALPDFVNIVAKEIPNVIEKISSLNFLDAAGKILRSLGAAILSSIDVLSGSAGDILSGILNFISDNARDFAKAAVKILGKLAKAIGDNVAEIIPAATDIVLELANSFLGADYSDNGQNIVGGLVTGISDSAFMILDAVPDLLGTLFDGLLDNLPMYLGQFVGAVGKSIKKFFTKTKTGDIVKLLVNGFAGNEKNVEYYLNKLAKDNYSDSGQLTKAFIDFGVGLNLGAMDDFDDRVDKSTENTKRQSKEAADAVKKDFLKIQNGHVELSGGIIAENAFAKNNFIGEWNNAPGEMGGVWSMIVSAFNISDAESWGSDMIQNFIDGINKKIGELRSVVTTTAGILKSFWGHSVPEKGPLSDDDKWGGHLMDNIINGIESKRGELQREVEGVAESMDFNRAYTFTPTVTGTYNESVTGRGEKINRLVSLLETYLPEIGHIELDGEVVANSVDQRLGRIAAQKARV